MSPNFVTLVEFFNGFLKVFQYFCLWESLADCRQLLQVVLLYLVCFPVSMPSAAVAPVDLDVQRNTILMNLPPGQNEAKHSIGQQQA